MTAVDTETSKQSQNKSGNNKKSSPQKRDPENVGKQTIKAEKKEQEPNAVSATSVSGKTTTPVRNQQKKIKETIKPKEKVKKAPTVSSQKGKGVEATTERKPKKTGKKVVKPDKKGERAPDSPSGAENGVKVSPVREEQKAGTQTIEPGNKKKNAPIEPSDAGKDIQSTPVRSKATRKGRPKVKTKRSPKGQPRGQRATRKKRKESSKPKSEEAKIGDMAVMFTNKFSKKAKRKAKNRQQQIPLVPFFQNRVGIARGPMKYRLKRAETDNKHRQRVQSNRRMNRKRTKSTKRKHFDDYGGNYWSKSEADLFDLSSIECGSYDDKMDVEEEENIPPKHKASGQFRKIRYQKKEEVEWGNGLEFEDLEACVPSTFAFNPSAPEFVPQLNAEKESTERESTEKKPVIFTMSELLKSVKGQELPTMPTLKPFIKSRNS